MDAATGEVLLQRDPDLLLSPASTTKVVTAIVVLESGRSPYETLTVSKSAARAPSSKLFLRPGQTMSIRDLLYALLLSSANDASLVLAEGIGGSVERFAEMMTHKAREIGALNTRFANPHGLTAPEHFSTARDIALIFNYAMKNPVFREIVQTKTSSVNSIFPSGPTVRARQIPIRSHNRLLWDFDGALGGKTGYTLAAQWCFVGAAARNGATLIVSVLGSRSLWTDTKKLLEYGLENYEALKLMSGASMSSLINGQSATRADKSSSPLFSWAEERRLQSSLGYVLQVASFRERERAESLQKFILTSGMQASVEPAPLANGDTTYRVRVGPYAKLAEAQAAAREIENKSGFKAIVVLASPTNQPGPNPS